MLRRWRIVSLVGRRFCTAPAQPGLSGSKIDMSQQAHPKSILFQLCAKLKWRSPKFEYSCIGPHHARKHSATVTLFVGNEQMEFTSSHPRSRKGDAEFEATLAACEELKKRGLLQIQLPSVKEEEKPSQTVALDEPCQLINQYPALARLKSHPKSILLHFSNLAKPVERDYRDPKAHFQLLADKSWLCKLSASWPSTMEVNGRATSKAKAEYAAYMKLLEQWQAAGYFDHNWRPKFQRSTGTRDREAKKSVTLNLSPLPTALREEIDRLKASVEGLSSDLTSVLNQANATAVPSTAAIDEKVEENVDHDLNDDIEAMAFDKPIPSTYDPAILDIITNQPYAPLDEHRSIERSHDLYMRWMRSKKRISGSDQPVLPITAKKDEIIDLLNRNRAIIIAGGTGCGKTTQMPQFILDDFVQRLEGAKCNIVVTQPRRISAISVAERIAWERFEQLGDTVGYAVRLANRPPQGNGSIYFLTSAMLLKKIWGNSNLEGISHVIVDEVHERDLWTDFLLIILKEAMQANPKLKVILMSASMDSEKFADYFGGCPVVNVESRIFEVEEQFLDDMAVVKGSNMPKESSDVPLVNHKLVVDTLAYVHENRPEGAILCFLPGWQDIVKTRQIFEERPGSNQSDYVIYSCHSRVPLEDQQKIFTPAVPGVRKIVLATNIAETSITINDVRYVVNSGLRKNTTSDRNFKSLRQEWASRSSQIQRKGRAGRVRDGECFHLFTKSEMEEMRPYDLPSMVKEPLENVILFSKLCCPNEDPETLLLKALDKPPPSQVSASIRLLTDMRILDENGSLTTLGKHVARFGCHPMFGVSMVYSALFRCVEPIVTLTGILQTAGIFMQTDPSQDYGQSGNPERQAKERFVGDTLSDHMALINLFMAYKEAEAAGNGEMFRLENQIRADNLHTAKALRRLFAWELTDVGLFENTDQCFDSTNWINENSKDIGIVKAVLAAGLHDQVVCFGKGVVNRGRTLSEKKILVDESNYRYLAPGTSLFNSRALADVEHTGRLFLYANKFLINGTRSFKVDGFTEINPVVALLFAGRDPSRVGDDTVNMIGRRYQIVSDPEDLARLLRLRQVIRDVVNWTLELKSVKKNDASAAVQENLKSVKDRLVKIIGDLSKEPIFEKCDINNENGWSRCSLDYNAHVQSV